MAEYRDSNCTHWQEAKPSLISRRVLPWTKAAKHIQKIYIEAFPPQERVAWWFLFGSELLRPNCKLLAWFDPQNNVDNEPVGFTFSYVYGDLKLLLFLAVDGSRRSGGYGRRILSQVEPPKTGGVVALQLEPLDLEAANAEQRERRWNFYLRAGFRPSPLFSEEDGEQYATMIRGRELGQAEFAHVLRKLMIGTRKTRVFLPHA